MENVFREEKLIKGITIVFIANLIGAVFNIVLNFVLPKYLTVDTYAGIKTYQLYITFVGIFHFGFIDGVYLEYGGAELRKISKNEIAKRINTFRFFQFGISVICIIISVLLRDDILLFFSLSIPVRNGIAFFQLLYQATGEYARYSRLAAFTAIIRAVASIFVLLFVSRENYIPFLIASLCADMILYFYLEISIHRRETRGMNLAGFSARIVCEEVRSGFLLRIGILSGFFLTGMDRIFVKFLMNTASFALYSFAVTVENILNILITPVTTSLYNYLCNVSSGKQLQKVKNAVMIGGSLILVSFFPTKLFICLFLDNYSESLTVLSLLFVAKSLYILIDGIYANLYKVKRMQHLYIYRLLMTIVCGFILNGLGFLVYKKMISFAIATLLTTAFWLLICARDFPDIGFSLKEKIYGVGAWSAFIITSIFLNPIVGGMTYLLFILLLSYIFMYEETKLLQEYAFIIIRKRLP